MIHKIAQDKFNGYNIKRVVYAYQFETTKEQDQWERGLTYVAELRKYCEVSRNYDVGYRHYHSRLRMGLLIGVKNGDLRIRYPNPSYSRLQSLEGASTDLKSLSALWICGLIASGEVADRLEEEFSVHSEAAQLLRKFEQYQREKELPNGP